MRHSIEGSHNWMAGDIASQCKAQWMFITLERLTFNNITQGDQSHLIVWNFDTYITMTGHWRLNTDARCSKRQGEIVCQRGNLVDAHFCAAGSCLDEERLYSKLRNRRSAIDLYHLYRCTEG